MGEVAEIRKRHSRDAAQELIFPIKAANVPIDGIIQCGLGDWAEGPVLLDMFPHMPMFAIDPVHRYAHQAWANGFRGPIIQGFLGSKTGDVINLRDWRTRTSIHDQIKPRANARIDCYTVTLDDAIGYVGFKARSVLLWMDCEGAEAEILKGAVETLRHTEVIICELKDTPELPGWPTASTMISLFDAVGFFMAKRVRNDGLFLRKWYRPNGGIPENV